MITLKEDIWFACSFWNWVVREGNCEECEYKGKPECPRFTSSSALKSVDNSKTEVKQ